MKTVTAAFTDALKAPSTAYVRQVYYKRRYWVESSKSYSWETNWTRLTEDKIVECSEITWQLDIQTLNQFQTANITLTLENLTNQWKGDNPYGIFAKDTASPLWGYYPLWTKFQVRIGVIKVDGTTEVVPVFTGVATEYTFDSDSGSVQVTVNGLEATLIAANAEHVSTTITNETATGSVDGANKTFTTSHTGVGIVTEVSDNGITKRAGVDYTLSNLNTAGTAATITFVVAPVAGHTIRSSYVYWKASQKFEDLVALLLTEGGVAGGSQVVSPVIFPSNVINAKTYQQQADWDAGTKSGIDTTTLVDSIKMDFASTVARQLTTYADSTSGWTAQKCTLAITASYLTLTTTLGANLSNIYRPQTHVIGRWEINFKIGALSGSGNLLHWFPMANQVVAETGSEINDSALMYQGYAVTVYYSGSGTTMNIGLRRVDHSTDEYTSGETDLGNSSQTADTSGHTIVFVRYPSGRMVVSFDGTQIIDSIDNTYTTSTYTGFTEIRIPSVCESGTLYIPTDTMTATWTSAAFDSGATPSAWAQITWTQTLNGGTIAYATESSADNISYDAFVAIGSNGVNGSTLRRYLKTKITMTASLFSNYDPTVTNLSVGSITSSTVVTLANFTGMTCYDAITQLGKFANYEFGFAPDETFYFRPKATSSTALLTIDQTTYNLILRQIVNGYDRVYSMVRATYGSYITDLTDDGTTALGPLKSAGANRIEIDGGNVLVSADADVATGVAGGFLKYYAFPRQRVKMATKVIPQLDLSDVIDISFVDNLPVGWYIGDSSSYIGNTALNLYGAGEQLLYQMLVKVVGMRIDTDNWTTEFDFEEVI